MASKGKEEVHFSVLENGLDFIYSALDHLQGNPSARDLKYAVLHLSAGVELVLKDRLQREHWSLVFNDLNKAEFADYTSGDFYSVDLKSCLQRLTSICGIEISEKHHRAILNLKNKRNRLEHFAAVDSAAAIKALSARVLNFIIDFTSSEFQQGDLEEKEARLLDNIRTLLPVFSNYISERMKAIQGELISSETPVIECPRCTQEAMIIDDGGSCLFCGYSATGESAASDYAKFLYGMDWKYVADGGEIPIYRCPECWGESLVDIGTLKGDYRDDRCICFSCGSGWGWEEIEFCDKCGSPFSAREDGFPICGECFP